MADRESQKRGAAELVERARLHDQNAMGMIDSIRQNAEAGDETAKSAIRFILDYIKANPVRSFAGAEQVLSTLKGNNPDNVNIEALCNLPHVGGPDDIGTACVILSIVAPITSKRVKEMAAMFEGDERESFIYGYENSGNVSCNVGEDDIGPMCAGHIIGVAQKMQAVKSGVASPDVFGADVAWEHT